MLERYFIRQTTIDRIRASWMSVPIERYVNWLTEKGYAPRNVLIRVPLLMRFGEFARESGATIWEELPNYVEPFVNTRLKKRGKSRATEESTKRAVRAVSGPIHQVLRLIIPGSFQDGQLRTLQRRVRNLRQIMARNLIFANSDVIQETESGPIGIEKRPDFQ